jgi:NADPH-dependent 2,4-dienoyl-CoA reductase/sulfur reductase-like enzyme
MRISTAHGGVPAAAVGGGPSGFYAADQLLKAGFRVDVLEASPTRFGLVRAVVAPDHTKIKSAHRGVIPNDVGRVLPEYGRAVVGEYVAGWNKRGWRAIDDHETSFGTQHGRPRVKLVDRAAMLAVAATPAGVTR